MGRIEDSTGMSAECLPTQAIRGGVPLVFPQFGQPDKARLGSRCSEGVCPGPIAMAGNGSARLCAEQSLGRGIRRGQMANSHQFKSSTQAMKIYEDELCLKYDSKYDEGQQRGGAWLSAREGV